ncbi:MAG: hypothetical protein CL846_06295 [Crocinitomicaceae bacterium]|nr:hypothetical protein [Crocinitomicaceae bacterium]
MSRNKIFILFFVLMTSLKLSAQGTHLLGFDDKKFHFGFALSYNQSDYYIKKAVNFNFNQDSLQSLVINSKPGFTLGVVSSINFNPNFKLRFAIPSLSFQERDIVYTYMDVNNDTSYVWSKKVEPTYLDFPILLKFRTDRINNWAMYGITGLRFGLDMSSQKDVNNTSSNLADQIIKLKKPDFGMEIGGGFDFFLEYFKFGIELKLGVGMMNVHLNEGTQFDTPIGSLRSKVWTLSLTFEG